MQNNRSVFSFCSLSLGCRSHSLILKYNTSWQVSLPSCSVPGLCIRGRDRWVSETVWPDCVSWLYHANLVTKCGWLLTLLWSQVISFFLNLLCFSFFLFFCTPCSIDSRSRLFRSARRDDRDRLRDGDRLERALQLQHGLRAEALGGGGDQLLLQQGKHLLHAALGGPEAGCQGGFNYALKPYHILARSARASTHTCPLAPSWTKSKLRIRYSSFSLHKVVS